MATLDPKLLPASLRPYAGVIDEVEDLRASEDSFIVHLADGWGCGDTHSIIESTIGDVVQCLRQVTPCTKHGNDLCGRGYHEPAGPCIGRRR